MNLRFFLDVRGLCVIALLLSVFTTSAVFAAPPTINYQGRLTDSGGNPVNVPVTMVFKLYTDATSGTEVWSETHTNVPVTGGVFQVILGSQGTPLDPSDFNSDLFLGIAVDGDPEMTPRLPIASAGYSLAGSSVGIALTVDCSTDSLQDAIDSASPGVSVTITVNGTCNEDIYINRDRVTLLDGSSGKIVGQTAYEAAVTVDGANNVQIVGLTIESSQTDGNGVSVSNNGNLTLGDSTPGGGVTITKTRIGASSGMGGVLRMSYATFTANRYISLNVGRASTASVENSMFTESLPRASTDAAVIHVNHGGNLTMRGDNTVNNTYGGGAKFSIDAFTMAAIRQGNGHTSFTGDMTLVNTNAQFRDTTINGDVEVAQNSNFLLRDQDSTNADSSLVGDLVLYEHSTANLDSTSIAGDLTLQRGSIGWVWDTVTFSGSPAYIKVENSQLELRASVPNGDFNIWRSKVNLGGTYSLSGVGISGGSIVSIGGSLTITNSDPLYIFGRSTLSLGNSSSITASSIEFYDGSDIDVGDSAVITANIGLQDWTRIWFAGKGSAATLNGDIRLGQTSSYVTFGYGSDYPPTVNGNIYCDFLPTADHHVHLRGNEPTVIGTIGSSCTAWTLKVLEITAVTGNGTVTSTGGSAGGTLNCATGATGTCRVGGYNPDDVVTLTATPDSGWVFSTWGGNCAGLSASDTITMASNKSCWVSFTAAP